MADRVQLIAELIDKVTGPAMKAGGALSALKRKVTGFAGASLAKAQKAFVSVGAGAAAAGQRFMSFGSSAINSLKSSAVGKAISGAIGQTTSFGKRMVGAAASLGRDFVAGFQQSKFGQAASSLWGKIQTGASAAGAKVSQTLKGAFERAKPALAALGTGAKSAFGAVAAAAAKVLPSASAMSAALAKASQKALDFTKNALLIGGAIAAGIGAAIGKLSIGMADFTQRADVAFSLLARDGASPAKLFEHTRQLAVDLGLDVMDTTKTFQKFLALQFDPAQATGLIKMGADMQALGASGEEVSRIMAQLGQIKAKGKLQGEELIVLAENGLSTELVFKALAKQMGVSMDVVKKKISSGAVGATDALNAIGDAILAKTHTTEFGQAGKKMATSTLSGMAGVLKAGVQNLFITVGKKSQPAIMKAFGSIFALVEGFSKGDGGAAFADGIANAVAKVAAFVESALPVVIAFFSSFGSAALSGIRTVIEALGIFSSNGTSWIEVAKGIGTALGQSVAFLFGVAAVLTGVFVGAVRLASAVVNGLVSAFNFVVASIGNVILWFDNVSARVTAFMSQILAVPGQIISGLVNGIVNGTGLVVEAISNLGSSILTTLWNKLKVGSPSKEMEWTGEMMQLGLQKGWNDNNADLSGPAVGGIDTSVPSPSFASGQDGLAGAGGGPVSVSVQNTYHIDGSKNPVETAKGIERINFSALGSALEQARIETAA